jgi:hypothetical protein
LVVEKDYGEYLRRAVDGAGLTGWSNFLAQGGTSDQLRALLLGSGEYFQIAGNTNATFLAALYRDILGRSIDSYGLQAWTQVLSEGFSRTDVAGAILTSPEAYADEVQVIYRALLHRPADSAGLQAFTTDLEKSVPIEAIIAAIIGSQEYLTNRVG